MIKYMTKNVEKASGLRGEISYNTVLRWLCFGHYNKRLDQERQINLYTDRVQNY
jgi:hypothetical protein